MKKFLTPIALLFLSLSLSTRAQDRDIVSKTTIQIEDINQPALAISFQSHDDDVEDVLKEEIKRNDGKVRTPGRFILGKGIIIKQIADNERNIYWKIDSKGRKKKEIVTVIMAVQNPDGSFLSDSAHTSAYTNAYAWLSALPRKVEIYQKDQELAALRKQLKKVTEELRDMQGASSDHRKAFSKKSKELKQLEEKIDNLQRQNR
ncbi:MAG: hypothetical protein JST39_04085 [Bacteroidetes bacterium]|nr:hypothetical protein [Bacteroidota bacterium]